jgi:DNA polymerase-3 subunit delta'
VCSSDLRCIACGWFAQSNHPDFRLLVPEADEEGGEGRAGRAEGKAKASRAIRIQQVRALSEFLAVGGHRGGRKVVLLSPADALNTPAANALLKTLEEPPGDTVFLLVTSHGDALPATIRSRCVAVGVPMPAPDVALAWLAAQEGIGPGSAPALLAAAGGAPLRALALAEPLEAAAHRTVLQALAELPDTTVIQAADTVAAHPARMWLPLLLAWVSDLGRVLAGAQPRRFPDRADRLARLARSTSLERVANYAAWLQHQQGVAEHPLNPRLLCEDTLLRYGALFPAEAKAKK